MGISPPILRTHSQRKSTTPQEYIHLHRSSSGLTPTSRSKSRSSLRSESLSRSPSRRPSISEAVLIEPRRLLPKSPSRSSSRASVKTLNSPYMTHRISDARVRSGLQERRLDPSVLRTSSRSSSVRMKSPQQSSPLPRQRSSSRLLKNTPVVPPNLPTKSIMPWM